MRTHTTFTDLRRIMKLHGDGLSADEISAETFIDSRHIQTVIDTRTKSTKRSKKFEKVTND